MATPPTGRLHYHYKHSTTGFDFRNNGHTFFADFSGLGVGGITYEENWYKLMNVNFHSLSEHTLRGQHEPLEVHLVHKKFNSDDLLVVAVQFRAPNKIQFMQELEEKLRKRRR